jgi:hypothetical protein
MGAKEKESEGGGGRGGAYTCGIPDVGAPPTSYTAADIAPNNQVAYASTIELIFFASYQWGPFT